MSKKISWALATDFAKALLDSIRRHDVRMTVYGLGELRRIVQTLARLEDGRSIRTLRLLAGRRLT